VSEPVTSSSAPIHDPDIPEGRQISVLVWIVIAVVYLAIVHLGGEAGKSQLGDDVEYGTFPDVETVWWALIVPVGASAIFAAIVTTVLGWWPQVLRDHRPVQRWVRIIPIIMLVTILIGTSYPDLFDSSTGFVGLFLIGALMVGFAEELMFRGLGVTVFRANGFSEKRVALWVAVAFGAAHSINLFTEGATALMQVLDRAGLGRRGDLVRLGAVASLGEATRSSSIG
jgi:CAAX protease family protein